MDGSNENVFEFLRNERITTVTVCQGRYVHKLRELAKLYPDECSIDAENADGSIVAHIPTNWLKISPPRKVELSDERRSELKERLKKMRQTKNTKIVNERERFK